MLIHVYYFFIFRHCSFYVYLTKYWPFRTTKMNNLINSTSCRLLTIRKERETWNVQCENTLQNVQCMAHENFSASLLMAKWTDVLDWTTRPHFYLLALLRLHIAKIKQHMYFFYYYYFRFLPCRFLLLILVSEDFQKERYAHAVCLGSFCFSFVKINDLLYLLLPTANIYVIQFFQN